MYTFLPKFKTSSGTEITIPGIIFTGTSFQQKCKMYSCNHQPNIGFNIGKPIMCHTHSYRETLYQVLKDRLSNGMICYEEFTEELMK